MTPDQAEKIIYESLLHTPGTRGEYFQQKQRESSHSSLVFCREINEALIRVRDYVNSIDYLHWREDRNGQRVYDKNCIQIRNERGEQIYLLTHENINEIFEPLREYCLIVFRALDELEEQRTKELEGENTGLRYLSWRGTNKQKEQLFNRLIEARFIDQETEFKTFEAIFSGSEIVRPFHRVTWIKTNPKGGAHKAALREFLTLLLGKFNEKVVPFCFIDEQGNPIKLSKPKIIEPSNYFIELETIITGLKT